MAKNSNNSDRYGSELPSKVVADDVFCALKFKNEKTNQQLSTKGRKRWMLGDLRKVGFSLVLLLICKSSTIKNIVWCRIFGFVVSFFMVGNSNISFLA